MKVVHHKLETVKIHATSKINAQPVINTVVSWTYIHMNAHSPGLQDSLQCSHSKNDE